MSTVPSPAPMRCWTVQPWLVYERLVEQGALTVDPQYVADLHHAYEWLREQMRFRLPSAAPHGYPWWAYAERPDLRRVRPQQPRGARYALMELECDRHQVLVFPHWAWDRIFYGRYLEACPHRAADWERRRDHALSAAGALPDAWPLPDPWQGELEASWLRLFDPNLPAQVEPQPNTRPLSRFEVVFRVLLRQSVRKITPFVGSKTCVCV